MTRIPSKNLITPSSGANFTGDWIDITYSSTSWSSGHGAATAWFSTPRNRYRPVLLNGLPFLDIMIEIQDMNTAQLYNPLINIPATVNQGGTDYVLRPATRQMIYGFSGDNSASGFVYNTNGDVTPWMIFGRFSICQNRLMSLS
jgi:hypothetical protein